MAAEREFPLGTLRFNELGTVHYLRGAEYETKFIYREVFEDREYEHEVLSWRPGMTIVDVGANIGFFAMYAQRKCEGKLRMLCVEPIPAIYQALRRNLDDHGLKDAVALNAGLTRFGGPETLEFLFYPRAPANSTCKKEEKEADVALLTQWADQRGAAPRKQRGWLAGLFAPLIRGLTKFAIKKAFVGVPVVCPLDTLTSVCKQHGIESIDLLKIDVEGAEWDVLNGIDAQLWPRIEQLALEVNDFEGRIEQITALLRQQGYTRVEVVRPQFAEDKPIKNFNLYASR